MQAKSLRARYQARYGIKQPLRGYQLRAAKVGVDNDSFALLMDPRLGKTRIDIAVTGYRFLQGQVTKWVIICPSIAKDVWKVELEDTLDVPYEIEIVEGKAEERRILLKGWKATPGKLSIMIINHEATWRLKKILYKTNPQKVTVDESQKIKNHAAKQSKAIHVLGRRADYRTILTGTCLSKPTDAFSQYKFLDPEIFGTLWKRSRFKRNGPPGFLDQYVDKFGFGGHKPETFKNLDQLQDKIASVAFQLTRAEAGGFPEEQYQTIHFELTNPALKHYNDMMNTLKTLVRQAGRSEEVVAEIVLTQALRLQQITGGFLPVRNPDDDLQTNVALGDDRLRALRGIVDEYHTTEPLVIFCRFRYELAAIIAQMKKMDRSVNFIAGGMKPGMRDQAKWDFQKGKIDTCVVQIRAGGIAIDLSRADTGIFYSSTSSLIDYEQAKARIIARTGGKVSLLSLAAKGTVDDDQILSLQTKQDLAKLILRRLD